MGEELVLSVEGLLALEDLNKGIPGPCMFSLFSIHYNWICRFQLHNFPQNCLRVLVIFCDVLRESLNFLVSKRVIITESY